MPAQNRWMYNGEKVAYNQIEQDNDYIPFGANDEDIQLYYDNENEQQAVGSLHSFYQRWRQFVSRWNIFLTEAHFIRMGTSTPNSNNVKIWFDTNNE